MNVITVHPHSDQPLAYLLTRFRATDPRSARELSVRLEAAARAAASEAGLVTYRVYVVSDDATTFYVSETWASSKDAARHIDLVQRTGLVQGIEPLLAEPLQVLTLVPLLTS